MCELTIGDQVWLDNIQFIDDPKWNREPQTIEGIVVIPFDVGCELCTVTLAGIDYLYTNKDIRKI